MGACGTDKESILNHLNQNDYLRLLDGDSVFILGVELIYRESSEPDSLDVTATLAGKDHFFTREGEKEISYDSWDFLF